MITQVGASWIRFTPDGATQLGTYPSLQEAQAAQAAALAEAVTKTEGGAAFPAAAFAYVPDPKTPAGWKLRLWKTPGGGPDAGIVGAAIAALGQGFRGNKVSIPAADLAGVKAKVRAAWTKANLDKSADTMPAVLKEAYSELALEARVALVRDAYYEQMQGSGVSPSDTPCPYVLEVRQDSVIVQDADDDYFEVPYAFGGDGADPDAVTFGDPTEVTLTYTPVPGAAASAMQESLRRRPAGVTFLEDVSAAAGAPEGSQWLVRVIAPGWSRNVSPTLRLPRYYPDPVLREAVHAFEGARIFQHEAGPHVDRHLRRSQDVVGWLAEAHYSGGICATYHCVDAALRTKLTEAFGLGKRDLMGFSINAGGQEEAGVIGGVKAAVVRSISSVDSVDVVSDPAAGGEFVRLVASVDPARGEPIMTIDQLIALIKAHRPALLEHAPAAGWTLDQLSAKLVEALAQAPAVADVKPLQEALAATNAQLAALQGAVLERDRRDAVATALDASPLAKVVKARDAVVHRISTSLREADAAKFTAALTEAIADQVGVVTELGSAGGRVTGFGRAEVGAETRDKHALAMRGMLFNADQKDAQGVPVPRFRSLHESYFVVSGGFKGYAPNPAQMLREAVMYQPSTEYGQVNALRESITSSTWAELLGDSITRRLVAEYAMPDLQDWRKIVSETATIRDFRTNRRTRMGGYGDLPGVSQGAPYGDLVSPTDEESTYAISKKGGVDDLTIETIANDDVGAVRRIPIKLGRAAARTLYKAVFDLIRSNGTIYDSNALFDSSTHANMTASALSDTTIKAGIAAMRAQTPYGVTAEPLGAVNSPLWLMVPAALEDLGYRLLNSDRFMGAVGSSLAEYATTPNLIKGRYGNMGLLVVDYWTDAADCAMVADPTKVPTIEVGFWNGQEDPELFVQDQPLLGSVFTADKVTYKIRHVWGLTCLEWRGFYGFSR
jgi:hypothetical protein